MDSAAVAYCSVIYVRVLCGHGESFDLRLLRSRLVSTKDCSMRRLNILSCLFLLWSYRSWLKIRLKVR